MALHLCGTGTQEVVLRVSQYEALQVSFFLVPSRVPSNKGTPYQFGSFLESLGNARGKLSRSNKQKFPVEPLNPGSIHVSNGWRLLAKKVLHSEWEMVLHNE